MATVQLYGLKGAGLVAIVDDADLPNVNRFKWYAKTRPRNSLIYAYANLPGRGNGTIDMHRLILPSSVYVDHRNHNGLDNRRCNLRSATSSENARNRRKLGGGFKCVEQRGSRFGAYIEFGGSKRRLGSYSTANEAARAYDAAAREIFGDFALCTFQHSTGLLESVR